MSPAFFFPLFLSLFAPSPPSGRLLAFVSPLGSFLLGWPSVITVVPFWDSAFLAARFVWFGLPRGCIAAGLVLV